MFGRIPAKLSVENFMGYLKWKSSLMILYRYANFKYDMATESFGAGVIMLIQLKKQKSD